MLNPSLLLTLFITPSWKYLSSPPAVLPPIYHLSPPRTSLKPSLLLSLPLRRPGLTGAVPRGESTPWDRDCCCEGMDLGAEVEGDAVEEVGLLVAAGVVVVALCCWWEGRCWRMEEKRVERKKGRWEKGRWEDILGGVEVFAGDVVGLFELRSSTAQHSLTPAREGNGRGARGRLLVGHGRP